MASASGTTQNQRVGLGSVLAAGHALRRTIRYGIAGRPARAPGFPLLDVGDHDRKHVRELGGRFAQLRGHWAAKAIAVPANVSLIHLPPYSPNLNPVERVWLHMRERFLSHRLFADLDAILEGCGDAWNRLVAEPGRIASLTDYAYLRPVRLPQDRSDTPSRSIRGAPPQPPPW